MKSDDRDLLLVCGCARSGMSLTMQMLDAGGYPVFGEFPSYEGYEFGKFPDCRDCAVKVPDPKHFDVPWDRCRIAYCIRDRYAQAKSQLRLMRALRVPVPTDEETIQVIAKSIECDDIDFLARTEAFGAPVYTQSFEWLIEEPSNAATRLAQFVADQRCIMSAMAKAVRPEKTGTTSDIA